MTVTDVGLVERVRFSHDIFRTQSHGGVGRYVTELHRGLLNRGLDSRVVAGLHRSAQLATVPAVSGLDVDRLRPARARQALTKLAGWGIERAWAGALQPSTVYHKTYPDHWVPSGPTLAVTVYDMIHERFPGQAGTRDHTSVAKRRWCEAADVVFAISDCTRADLLDLYRIDPEKVIVTPLGVSVCEPRPGPRPFGDEPFVLYVGSRDRAVKNWRRIVEAVRRLGPAGRLVCFGASPTEAEWDFVEKLGVRGRTHFAQGDDRELARYYQEAAVLAYVSLYEGFGLPPLEAMAHGCPVVAGDCRPFPEVLGSAACLVSPTDVDEIAGALGMMLESGIEAERLAWHGPSHAAQYTWHRTIEMTLDGYAFGVERHGAAVKAWGSRRPARR